MNINGILAGLIALLALMIIQDTWKSRKEINLSGLIILFVVIFEFISSIYSQ